MASSCAPCWNMDVRFGNRLRLRLLAKHPICDNLAGKKSSPKCNGSRKCRWQSKLQIWPLPVFDVVDAAIHVIQVSVFEPSRTSYRCGGGFSFELAPIQCD